MTVSKALVGAALGSALMLAACGSKSTENSADAGLNSTVEGTTNDMTAVDSATGEVSNMAGDTMANSAEPAGNASTNAM
jgi:ABC-type oligopeptide transport system substrate-binding subunit